MSVSRIWSPVRTSTRATLWSGSLSSARRPATDRRSFDQVDLAVGGERGTGALIFGSKRGGASLREPLGRHAALPDTTIQSPHWVNKRACPPFSFSIIAYTAFAGLMSLAYMDIVTGTIIVVTMVVSFPIYWFKAGAITSIFAGTLVSLVWSEAEFIQDALPESISDLDAVLPVIPTSVFCLIVVSLLTRNPDTPPARAPEQERSQATVD